MKLFATALVVAACALTLGCGKVREAAQNAKTANELRAIGLACHNYWDKNPGKGPAKAEDLDPFLLEFPVASKGLKDGTFVLFWGTSLTELMKGSVSTSDVVLGYEKDAPAKGGSVLMADGSVRRMTADDFKAAKKAKS